MAGIGIRFMVNDAHARAGMGRDDEKPAAGKNAAHEARRERLAQQLRANLKARKKSVRARKRILPENTGPDTVSDDPELNAMGRDEVGRDEMGQDEMDPSVTSPSVKHRT